MITIVTVRTRVTFILPFAFWSLVCNSGVQSDASYCPHVCKNGMHKHQFGFMAFRRHWAHAYQQLWFTSIIRQSRQWDDAWFAGVTVLIEIHDEHVCLTEENMDQQVSLRWLLTVFLLVICFLRCFAAVWQHTHCIVHYMHCVWCWICMLNENAVQGDGCCCSAYHCVLCAMDLTLNCLGNCRCCYMMDHMHFNSVLQTVTPIRMREVFVIMFVNLSRSVRASALSLGSRWNNWLVLLSVLKGHSVHLHW